MLHVLYMMISLSSQLHFRSVHWRLTVNHVWPVNVSSDSDVSGWFVSF